MIEPWQKKKLARYPALAQFDDDEAYRRLDAYEEEERKALQPWLTIAYITLVAALATPLTILHFFPSSPHPFVTLWSIPINGASVALNFWLHRRIRARVDRKVAMELALNRVIECLACGYPLLGTTSAHCPECGAENRATAQLERKHPMLLVTASSDADTLAQREDSRICAAIAIVDREDRPCLGFERIPARLRLDFDDVRAPAAPGPTPDAGGPTREHVQEIITFANRIRSLDGILLCHCTGGRSRSPAAALICLAVWLGPEKEKEAADALFLLRPQAQPHPDMVAWADGLLARGGRLVAAVERRLAAHPIL